MKILFCVEFYYPSVGGAQEVVRQVAERMVLRGHAVSVATSRIATRKSNSHNGVTIAEFDVAGNRVRGLQGEVARYQDFLASGDFDVILFYAAQQWTFDAAWPVLESISARKVLVPCGYSGLFEDAYRTYFDEIPQVLRSMDAIVYHAGDYRDVNFGKSLGLTNGILIPNAADTAEFSVAKDAGFRKSVGADASSFILMTVGTMTGLKGHLELVQAFAEADFGGRKSLLILNGNAPELSAQRPSMLRLVREHGWTYSLRHALKMFVTSIGLRIGLAASIRDRAEQINREQGANKRVVVTDLPRDRLIQAYLNADLFVFASNVEYSPLVLLEACAAGLPFLSTPVGNAAEIVAWTGGGELCEAPVDAKGYARVSPAVLARRMEALVADQEKLARLRHEGQAACHRYYNWETIAGEYESLFQRLAGTRQDATVGMVNA